MLHRVPLDPQGTRYEDWNEIWVLIAIVRAFAGAAWYPKEIAFRSNVAFGRFALEQFPNTHFLVGQEAAWITVPRNLLSSPLRLKSNAAGSRLVSSSGQAPDAEPAQDFPGSLKRLLASYLVQGQPSVKVAAALAGTSVRTLQRMLQECDTNYSDVLQQARFEVSTRLLHDKNIKIIDIAYEVGYEDPAHFTRAFKRLTGVGPHEYRCQLCLR
jgi:AraC-like DNA-binding protein